MNAFKPRRESEKQSTDNKTTTDMKKAIIIIPAVAAMMLTACGDKDAEYDASGVFETTEVIVSAKGTGEIVSLDIEEGQTVKAGQTLGELDMTQLTLKRQQLDAGKDAAASRRLDTGRQVASLRQQIANLQSEQARFKALLKDGAATQKQVDDIGYQIATLQKQLAATDEQVSTSNRSIDGQSAGFDAQIGQVDDMMRQARITSPISGVILSKYAERGEYAVPGRALFKVGDVSDMKLRAYITAEQLTGLKIGQKVTVYADQGTKGRKAYEGTVSWISSEAEFTPKTIQTRDERSNLVYAIKIAVKNDGLIKRGMYGDVKL